MKFPQCGPNERSVGRSVGRWSVLNYTVTARDVALRLTITVQTRAGYMYIRVIECNLVEQ